MVSDLKKKAAAKKAEKKAARGESAAKVDAVEGVRSAAADRCAVPRCRVCVVGDSEGVTGAGGWRR
jgi:hypothetical protein